MNKNEFLIMAEQDVATHAQRSVLLEVVGYFRDVLKSAPSTMDIDQAKTAEACFKEMRNCARNKSKDGCYYMPLDEKLEIAAKYLGVGLPHDCATDTFVALEDFL